MSLLTTPEVKREEGVKREVAAYFYLSVVFAIFCALCLL